MVGIIHELLNAINAIKWSHSKNLLLFATTTMKPIVSSLVTRKHYKVYIARPEYSNIRLLVIDFRIFEC